MKNCKLEIVKMAILRSYFLIPCLRMASLFDILDFRIE